MRDASRVRGASVASTIGTFKEGLADRARDGVDPGALAVAIVFRAAGDTAATAELGASAGRD